MTNEWAEFRAYTTQPVYSCASKRDHSYLGRFTLDMIQEPVGLARILTILARGYLFHDADGALLSGSPYDRTDHARRALCAWCSVPENKKAPILRWTFERCPPNSRSLWMTKEGAGITGM